MAPLLSTVLIKVRINTTKIQWEDSVRSLLRTALPSTDYSGEGSRTPHHPRFRASPRRIVVGLPSAPALSLEGRIPGGVWNQRTGGSDDPTEGGDFSWGFFPHHPPAPPWLAALVEACASE